MKERPVEFVDRLKALGEEARRAGDFEQYHLTLAVEAFASCLWDAESNEPVPCPDEPGALIDYCDCIIQSMARHVIGYPGGLVSYRGRQVYAG